MKKFILMTLALMVLFACNKDGMNDPKGNSNDIEDPAYAQVSFGFANGSFDTKAAPGPNGDGPEDGIGNENRMTDAIIVGYKKTSDDKNGDLGFLEYLNRTDFSPTGTGSSLTYTSKSFKVPTGDYDVYVIVNPVAPTGGTGTTTAEKYKGLDAYSTKTKFEAIDYSWQTTGSDIFPVDTTAKFLMSSARGAVVAKVDASTNTAANPLVIEVEVERIVAKITYSGKEPDNAYDLKNSDATPKKVGTVTFQSYDLVNLRNSAYLLRRATAANVTPTNKPSNNAIIGQLETVSSGIATNYVIENKFFIKSGEWSTFNALGLYNNPYTNTSSRTYQELPKTAGDNILTYTLENTMLKDKQLNGYSTGIIFKALYTPEADAYSRGATPSTRVRNDGTFYRYNNLLFDNLTDLANVTNFQSLKNHLTTNPETNTATPSALKDLLKNLGIDLFEGGICYYHYWIRHADNGNNASMGIMEFAIVRNNIYKLKIDKVSRIGKASPEVDPDTPDEDEDAFLKVEVKILPWTVRTNVIKF